LDDSTTWILYYCLLKLVKNQFKTIVTKKCAIFLKLTEEGIEDIGMPGRPDN